MSQSFGSVLSTLQKSQRVRTGNGGAPKFTAQQVQDIYAARRREVSWNDIHTKLADTGLCDAYNRASTLAQMVHESARKHGIEPFITAKSKKS